MLVDSNTPAQPSDLQLIEFLRAAQRSFLVVATKSDKLSGNKLRQCLATLARGHGVAEILPYSARTSAGRDELWREIRKRATRD